MIKYQDLVCRSCLQMCILLIVELIYQTLKNLIIRNARIRASDSGNYHLEQSLKYISLHVVLTTARTGIPRTISSSNLINLPTRNPA